MTEPTTPTVHKLDVIGATEVPFRVVFLPSGLSVNRLAANKYVSTPEPRVEFYDRRYEHTPDGQFICEYFVDTLLDTDPQVGLTLYGGSADWSVDGATMDLVRTWMCRFT